MIDHIARASSVFLSCSLAKARNYSLLATTTLKQQIRAVYHVLYHFTNPIAMEVIEDVHVEKVGTALIRLIHPLLHQFKALLRDDPFMLGMIICKLEAKACLSTTTGIYGILIIFIEVLFFCYF